MAGHMQLKSWFDGEKQIVGLQINEGEKAWAHITLELPEYQSLLRDLGHYRMQFAEQVPMDLDAGSRLEAIPDPRWAVRSEVTGLSPDAALLLLRHPGYGWLAFALPAHEAKAMGESLLKAAK